MVGTSVKETVVARKRLKIVKEMAGISSERELQIKPNTTDEEKKELMLKLLRNQFAKKEYKEALLSTEEVILHEKPLRGKPNNWTYKN